MNSTGSFQSWCLNITIVWSPSWRSCQLIVVPTHSAGPSMTFHSTRSHGICSTTCMSKPPGGKRNCNTPPTSVTPFVSSVHHPDKPSTVVSASYTFSGEEVSTPTRCRMSTISFLLRVWFVVLRSLDRLGDPLDPLQAGVPCRADRGQLGDGASQLCRVHAVALLPAGRCGADKVDAIEDREMLGHSLSGDRQLIAQRGRCSTAVDEQQIEHPPPRRVADRRPQVVVDPVDH